MIPCISYWAMEHGLAGTHPVEDAIDRAKAAGFVGIELAIGGSTLAVDVTQARCQEIRRYLDQRGMVCETVACGLSWGANPASNDAAVRQLAIEQHAAALERAGWLGCTAMLMVPGVVGSPITPNEHVRYDLAMERAREAVSKLLPVAERAGVDLCLENVWNGMFYSPLELIQFIDSFASKRLGVYFDIGNCLGLHQDPAQWIAMLGKRIRRVHAKDFKHVFGWQGTYDFCQIGDGDVRWPEVMAALHAIGYNSTVVAEVMPWSEGHLERTNTALVKALAA